MIHVPQGQDTRVMTGDTHWVKVTDEGVKTYEQITAENGFSPGPISNDEGVHMTVISERLMDSPSVAPYAWSSSFAQARREAIQLQAMEEQLSWMTEADQYMLHLGLEPVPWDQFAEATGQKGEYQFQAIEQRATEDNVMGSQKESAPNSLVGATIVVRSATNK
jgi:hypothetical protein